MGEINIMIAHTIKTNKLSGVTGRLTVAIDKETGSVIFEQRMILAKPYTDDLKACDVLRETDRYAYIVRRVHLHRETFGNAMALLSDLIGKTDLMNKFPDNFRES